MSEHDRHTGPDQAATPPDGADDLENLENLSSLDAFEQEAAEADEQDAVAADDELDELDLEAPEADTAEQRAELLQHRDEPITARPEAAEGEADPADVADQRKVVTLDEDDYRDSE